MASSRAHRPNLHLVEVSGDQRPPAADKGGRSMAQDDTATFGGHVRRLIPAITRLYAPCRACEHASRRRGGGGSEAGMLRDLR